MQIRTILNKTICGPVAAVVLAACAGGMYSPVALAQASVAGTPVEPKDGKIQADVVNQLKNKKFGDVQVAVHGGVVVLTGAVSVVADKDEAENKARRVKNVTDVHDTIQVGGEVSDAELKEKLIQQISTSRIGYGTTAFNAIGVDVQGGVVTLNGHAYGPTDKDDALGIAKNTRGVKSVVDKIEVDPVSPFDDRTRIAVSRAVYGFPTLNKYAINPAKPIRISVQGGKVTLYGVVDSQADKDTAGIRANSVPNVFSVTNDLQVAGKNSSEK